MLIRPLRLGRFWPILDMMYLVVCLTCSRETFCCNLFQVPCNFLLNSLAYTLSSLIEYGLRFAFLPHEGARSRLLIVWRDHKGSSLSAGAAATESVLDWRGAAIDAGIFGHIALSRN